MSEDTASDPVPDPDSSIDATEGDDAVSVGPPVAVLAGAALCVLVGILLVFPGSFATHVAGYVASPMVAILLVGLYRRLDLRRRLSAGYRPNPAIARVIPVILVIAFVVAAVHVWAIATEVAS